MEKQIATILIIDDEQDVVKGLKDTLTHENFTVQTAPNGRKGIDVAKSSKPHLILLDLRLPDMDGYDVCRELKALPETQQIPVIMVSTRSKDTEKIIGLELGADDYVTKPFNELELLARIRVALRRKNYSSITDENKPLLSSKGNVSLNPETRKILVAGKEVNLTRKEFDLLAFLLAKPGKVFKRSHLLEAVWGYEIDSLQGTVDSHVKTLRKKIGPAGAFVETVTGVGYRWAEEEQ